MFYPNYLSSTEDITDIFKIYKVLAEKNYDNQIT